MKSTGFTTYVPISETEYGKFRELKNKEAKLVKDEINRPAPLLPLVEANNEKDQVLFSSSGNAEQQEQRYLQLLNIVTGLKKKLEQQEAAPREVSQEAQGNMLLPQHQQQQQQQQRDIFPNIISRAARQKAKALHEMMGQDVWNMNNELVVDGSAVPGSSKEELMNYATTNWRTKYNANKKPVGASNFLKLAKEKHAPAKLLGDQAKKSIASSSSPIRGLALITKRARVQKLKKKTKILPVVPDMKMKKKLHSFKSKNRRQLQEDDFQVLTDAKVFNKVMATKQKTPTTI
jgi:hypothetical protein